MPGGPSLWQEARSPDGRVYYFNAQTKATQWTKPVELMTPVEVCTFYPISFLCSAELYLLILFFSLCSCSALYRTSHGKNIQRKVEENIGIIQNQGRALGRCQRSTKLLLRRQILAHHFPSRKSFKIHKEDNVLT